MRVPKQGEVTHSIVGWENKCCSKVKCKIDKNGKLNITDTQEKAKEEQTTQHNQHV